LSGGNLRTQFKCSVSGNGSLETAERKGSLRHMGQSEAALGQPHMDKTIQTSAGTTRGRRFNIVSTSMVVKDGEPKSLGQ
jgi:hypothetical protein